MRAANSEPATASSENAYKVAEKAYKRDGRQPTAGLSDELLAKLLDFDE